MRLHQPVELLQDPRRLQYTLFLGDDARSFSRSALTVVQEARASAGPYTAVIAIIGESHVVCIEERARLIAVELLACIDPEICGAKPTLRRGYADVAAGGSLEVACDGVVVAARLAEHRRRDDGWALPPPQRGETAIGLVHSFPGPGAPRTFAGIRIDRPAGTSSPAPWRLRISTIHEYLVHEGPIVITTETAITIEAEGGS